MGSHLVDQLIAENHEIVVFDNQSGKVVIEFRLYKDGTIRQMSVTKNEVAETLAWCCQRAISDPAPYAPFPNDLKRLMKDDFRAVRFIPTFPRRKIWRSS